MHVYTLAGTWPGIAQDMITVTLITVTIVITTTIIITTMIIIIIIVYVTADVSGGRAGGWV